MCCGMDDALLCPYVVMTVPVQVLVSIGGFPINTSGECSTMFWCDHNVQWHRTILRCILHCKFNGTMLLIFSKNRSLYSVHCITNVLSMYLSIALVGSVMF